MEELKKVRKTLRDSSLRKIRKLQEKGFTSTPAVHGLTTKMTEGKVAPIKLIKLNSRQAKAIEKAQKEMAKAKKKRAKDKAKWKKLKAKKAKVKAKAKEQQLRAQRLEAKKPEAQRRRDMITESLEYQTFNQKPTSTVRGATKFEKDLNERLGKGYENLTEKQKSKFWDIYEEQRKYIEDYLHEDSERLQEWLASWLERRNAKRITKNDSKAFDEFVSNLYESKLKYEAAQSLRDSLGFSPSSGFWPK